MFQDDTKKSVGRHSMDPAIPFAEMTALYLQKEQNNQKRPDQKSAISHKVWFNKTDKV